MLADRRRTDQEMYDLILGFARADERVRMVGMNGSRVNQNAPKDKLQDYDVVYFVTDVNSFLEGDNWLDYFGELLIMQKPDDMELFPSESRNSFAYLMLFKDGNRIDLSLVPVKDFQDHCKKDRLFRLLLDKDSPTHVLPEPSDEDFRVKRPTCRMFDDCCNEFWWVTTYVAKGLWRGEFTYAAKHMEFIREELLTMLSWKIGAQEGFTFSVGKQYKYIQTHLDPADWTTLLATYRFGSEAECWQALFVMQDLFEKTSQITAQRLACALADYGKNVRRYNQILYSEWQKKAADEYKNPGS